MAQPKPDLSETQSCLLNRVSVRKYRDAPVSEQMIDDLLQAAFRAPTSSNIQAYSVVVVRDKKNLQRLSVATKNQKHVADTPVFLAFCADLTRLQAAAEAAGQTLRDNNLEMGLVSTIDATLVGMSASLVAESFGLKGVMIGAVRNDPLEIADILGLPDQVYCVFGMCLGWPDEAPRQKPRMAQAATVHFDRYGATASDQDPEQLRQQYDRDLANHYQSIGKPTTENSWSDEIAKKFTPQPRPGLRAALKQRGFDFL